MINSICPLDKRTVEWYCFSRMASIGAVRLFFCVLTMKVLFHTVKNHLTFYASWFNIKLVCCGVLYMDASYVFSWVIGNIIAPIVVGVLLIALEKIFEMNHQKTKKEKKGLTNGYNSDKIFSSSDRGVFCCCC